MQALTALRLIIGAALLLAFAATMAVVAHQASAGAADGILTVNSVGNDDDGDCEGPPNAGSGDCTLREAINAVNAGLADTINFHKPTFPKSNPGVILLDADLGAGKGDITNCLPAITREVTIDSSNTGVILDGDGQDDAADVLGCDRAPGNGVIQVNATNNGFDFELIGGKNFIIREFGTGVFPTDGINLCGDCADGTPYTFGDVLINGYIFQDGDTGSGDDDYDSEDGIDFQGTTNIRNAVIDNVDITADDEGIEVDVNGNGITKAKLTDNSVQVTGSTIIGDNDRSGSGDGVQIDFEAPIDVAPQGPGIDDESLNGKITANVSDNTSITSFGEDGVDLAYCKGDAQDCEAGGDMINFWVNNNSKIHGGEDDFGATDDDHAVEVDVFANDGGENSGGATIDVQVNGNGLIDAGSGDGVNADVAVCCNQGSSTSSIQVNENDDIIGDNDAVDLEVDLGCGDQNDNTIDVNDNGSLEGSGESEGDGVEISADVGEVADGCDGDEESDDNSSVVNVNGNELIDGGAQEGVDVNVNVGADTAGGDDNLNEVHVDGNGEINGDDDGVDIDTLAGSTDGSDADENTAITTVSDNGRIEGSDSQGIEIDSDTGVQVDLDGGAGDIGDNGPGDQDGDENLTQVMVNGNESVVGNDDDGVFLNLQAGGETISSTQNRIDVEIAENGELIGRQDTFGAGIEIDLGVCCDDLGLNTVNVHDNGDIIGRAADGIFLDMCCAGTNVTDISKNGTIRGNGNNGIDYDVDIWSDGDADFGEPCPEECGIFNTVNFLVITNNDIFNSGGDGIEICCGAFQYPTNAGRDLGGDPSATIPCEQGAVPPKGEAPTCAKSLIANNTIHHNRGHGIQLHSTFGMNIMENEIYSNGDDPQEDRGIEIDSDSTDAIGEDFADFIEGNFVVDAIIADTRANQNRISQNSIYDNIGLGIDLIGDNDQDTEGDHRVGCRSFATIPSPNDCLPFPVIQTQSVDKLVGTACTDCLVEIFIADDTPADQEPLGTQHGEGVTFLVDTEADGDGNWSVDLPCDLGNSQLTATGTDKLKNTSEFSANFLTLGTGSCATDTPTPAPPTDTPTPAPATDTPTPTSGPVKICGDADFDGSVTSLDSLHVLQFKAGFLAAVNNPSNANVNGQDGITSIDAALILQYVAAFITELNGCV